MARLLNGSELAGFIKERQAYQVRNLRQEHGVAPTLRIVMPMTENLVIDTYVRLKQRYAEEIGVDVQVIRLKESDMTQEITRANDDPSIHGIIVQLPLDDPVQTDHIVAAIASEKDVDGLGEAPAFVSATAEAIDWLLAGYNVDLGGKKIAILGRGRLVGRPLETLWRSRGYHVTSFDASSKGIQKALRRSSVIVTATGQPGLVTNELISKNAVVVDAGTASEDGVLIGDVDESLRERRDIVITPKIGGVGPMTIVVMFDHVIQASLKTVGKL